MPLLRYYVFLIIFVIPAIAVDDAITNIESGGFRYLLRAAWFLAVFAVLNLIPKPAKSH